ncbi:PssD/Cps14F family polysaccharide biosynthesis glycosyltransferase [Colwellia sp. E2M01]|uniref:PssD/Cps14F family polysaccharide biosynthesis glycosyltransferase n=1 Tax=Colwellia sp. E2M01 TaxID=2841561 RepID=UPI001C084B2A|nr:PssD/Cps14F family polysaccharide biosynthesis glycosyltransferase [Colwellia sp. E2M01]MBU2870944.1 hypothetical protein [Colwellia sp. E2M01]
MSKKVFLAIYSKGGHKDAMERLLFLLKQQKPDLKFVSIADLEDCFGALEHIVCPEPRDKFNVWRAPIQLCHTGYMTFLQTVYLLKHYKISGMVSTGTGMVIIPALILRLMNKNVIHIEDWSRFNSRSYTGKVMYYIANKFYVQNESLLKKYPRAIYSGRL